MKLHRIRVTIEEGKLKFKSDYHRDIFTRYLNQFNGKTVDLEIFELRSKRSEMQNRFYWLYLGIIEDELGEDKDVLHSYFKSRFLTKGITEIKGDKVRITKSTTELTKGEFCDYITNISALIQIEPPNTTEYWGYNYRN